jgi:predicted RNase H-like HicB family nuclease
MLTRYIEAAMKRAEYEKLEDGTYYGEIPGFQGVWGNAKTIEECREELQGALESWLIAKLWDHDDDIPVLGKLSLTPRKIRLPRENGPAAATRSRKAS